MKLSNALKQTIKIRQLEQNIAYLNGKLSMLDDEEELLEIILQKQINDLGAQLKQLLEETNK